MKRIVSITAVLLLSLLVLAGCSSEMSLRVNEDNTVTIDAKRAKKDQVAAAGTLTVAEGEVLVAEPSLKKGGEIQLLFSAPVAPGIEASPQDLKDATSGENAAFEFIISGSEPQELAVDPGDYFVSAKVLTKADGTVTIRVKEGAQ